LPIRCARACLTVAMLSLLPVGFAEDKFQPARLLSLPLTKVRIGDSFWLPRMKTNQTRTLAIVRQRLIETGAIENFAIASGRSQAKFRGPYWSDSDVYKWLEGVSYSLALEPNPALEAQADEVIALIAASQQSDGYLDTFFQLVHPDMKWKYLAFGHEMFCAGHLFEAAVAHFEATGKRTLLDIAVKNADHIERTFGPGRRDGQPGHEEIELGLVKLFRATGERRYLQLAQFFIDQRGQKPSFFEREYAQLDPSRQVNFLGRTITFRTLYDDLLKAQAGKLNTEYSQDHLPVRRQDKVVGHAVRAMYLYSGMADVAAETGEKALLDALQRLYADLTTKRMYLTGGIGPSAHNEGFTTDYDLPNETAYQETCASIGVAMWAQRMLAMTGDGQYADAMELALYNAFPAGVSLDGEVFFYDNPLYSRGKTARKTWFTVPCCPTNVARILPSISKYVYSQSRDALWVNLFVQGEAAAQFAGGERLEIAQQTSFPADGRITLAVKAAPASERSLFVRVPGWASAPRFLLNGRALQPPVERGYARLSRRWMAGDRLVVDLPMAVQRIESHPAVVDNRGRIALRYGPFIYCLEQADNPFDIDRLVIPAGAKLAAAYDPNLLGGVPVVAGAGMLKPETGWEGMLYRPAGVLQGPVNFRAVPYAVWANRGPGKMAVWIESAR